METDATQSAQDSPANEVHTLVIGVSQAGLATSYFLSQAGVEHLVLEGRAVLGGA